jgi:apolipoprotein N-acyltransferase
VTDDTWFGHGVGPRQHYEIARVRAIEEGLPLVRAANNGISAVIDARGRVLKKLGFDAVGTLDFELPLAEPPTLYARLGDFTFLGLWLLVALISVAMLRIRGGQAEL